MFDYKTNPLTQLSAAGSRAFLFRNLGYGAKVQNTPRKHEN
jgi:hypothetical protein